MNVNISFCTPSIDETSLESRLGKYNIFNSEQLDKVNVVLPYYENKKKISTRYNAAISNFRHEDSILVLAHDDIVITDKSWIEKLHQALEKYDVVGLAGASRATIKEPALWHIMGDKEYHTGAVYHVSNENTVYRTYFGKHGRALLLDGLFLAFNPKKIYDKGIAFDETCPSGFHFYDLDFSLTCNKHQLKMGTANISVVHSSPGLKSFSDDWLSGQAWFLDKYTRGQY